MTNLNLDPCTPGLPVIIIGADATLNLEFENEGPYVNPEDQFLDITMASEIKAIFLSSAVPAGYIEEKLSTSGVLITNGPFGKCTVVIPAVDSAQLAPSPLDPNTGLPTTSDIEVRLTLNGKTSIFPLTAVVQIKPGRFPAAP